VPFPLPKENEIYYVSFGKTTVSCHLIITRTGLTPEKANSPKFSMECEQLIRLIKDWYIRVKQETMAPARMMQFVDQHVKGCPTCQADLLLPDEVEKIREFVLPESKIPKANRSPDDSSTPEISPDDGDEFEETEEYADDSEEDLDGEIDEEDDLSDDDVI